MVGKEQFSPHHLNHSCFSFGTVRGVGIMAWYTDMVESLKTLVSGIEVKELPIVSAEGHESLTVDNSITSLTPATYGDATSAFITVEDHPMRYRVDGDDATDAIGHLVDDGDSIILSSAADIANFSAIRTTADSATIRVTYYE